jgi:hypothetical protein
MNKNYLYVLMYVLMSMLAVSKVQAVTITFEPEAGGVVNFDGSYTESGITFNSFTTSLAFNNATGSTGLENINSFFYIDNGLDLFDLVSFDIVANSSNDTSIFTNDLTNYFEIQPGQLGTFFFGSEWKSINLIGWEVVSGSLTIDNIVIFTVPLPATLWLMSAAVLGLFSVGRRIRPTTR